jgi:heterodisulfide reductase subunit A2
MNDHDLVLVCDCCGTLCNAVSPEGLAAALEARAPGTRVIASSLACKAAELDRLAVELRKEKPARLAVAACSGSAKGAAILAGLRDRGVGVPMALADIREGCAWLHAAEPAGALAKAVRLVLMALAEAGGRALAAEPAARPVQSVLIVGAGPAGLAAATTLAGLGVDVTLAERLAKPGGLPARLGKLFPTGVSGSDFLAPLLACLDNPKVRFLSGTTVKEVSGDPGDFTARLSHGGENLDVNAGAVILATGAVPVLPEGRYRSKEVGGVISQMELETRLAGLEAGTSQGEAPDKAVFIQCLGARDDERPYCSSVCCPTALKNALRVKALRPEAEVAVLHRGIMTPGVALEELYRRAMAAGVRFYAFDPGKPPEVRGQGGVTGVAVTDALSGREFELEASLVVCSTPLLPQPQTAPLARALGVRLDEMGFACGVEPMRPLCPPLPGVYLCGAARWPVYAAQAVDQGYAAAAKAAAFLAGETVRLAGDGPAAIDQLACSRCGACAEVCPYGACRRAEDATMTVSAARCQGCGSCAAVCPSGAARLTGRPAATLRAMLRAAMDARTPL